ncbi:a5c6638c-0012-41a1-b479-01199bd3c0c7 [Thermothielavioides terrestris]|uniref:A5c6638c-0012-41a1-b479-01199bd3c0c7 n=1 Tax=Thermothielavioides terrestris TaxID=2587410 RepID=A0A446BQR1_9PEZI|nr:a5c6638c-0012-41a1-b479-01199bd3c0c7 [Thermothielavioides terrestris]
MTNRGVGFPNNGVDDQGWKLYITSLVMILAAGLVVTARVSIRLARRNFGYDDVAIVVALLFSIVLSVSIQLAVVHGYGMHKADLSKEEQEEALKWFFIAQTPYKVTVCLYKFSVILLYLRIFVTKTFRIAAFVVLSIVVGYSLGGIGATIFQCVPIRGAWVKNSGATCINSDQFWVAYAVLNILTDVLVLALPVGPIMSLHLRWRERFLIWGVFMLGAFVTVSSILRVASVQNSLKNIQDQTYNFIPRGIWTLVEANLGIISACLPVLKPPLSALFPRLFGSTGKKSTAPARSEGSRPGGQSNDPWSSVSAANRSNPRFWRVPLKHELSVSISAARPNRNSDEHQIIGASDKGSTNDSVELNDRAPNLKRGDSGGISKTVEVVRQSFHEQRGLASI